MLASKGQHSAGIYADMQLDGPEIGTLVVVVDRAKNLPNLKTVGKQDPYCAVRLGKEAKKTNTDRRGGQTPRWDQELRFVVRDSLDYHKIKVSIFNDDRKTDLIGEAFIKIDQVLKPGGGQSDAWHDLNSKGRFAGQVRIEFSFYDTRPRPEETQIQPVQTTRSLPVDPSQRKHGPRELPTPKRKPLPNPTLPPAPSATSTDVDYAGLIANNNITMPHQVPSNNYMSPYVSLEYQDQDPETEQPMFDQFTGEEYSLPQRPVASSFASSGGYSHDSGYESTEPYEQSGWMQDQYLEQCQTEWNQIQEAARGDARRGGLQTVQNPQDFGAIETNNPPQFQDFSREVGQELYYAQSAHEQRPSVMHSISAPVSQEDANILQQAFPNHRYGHGVDLAHQAQPRALPQPAYAPRQMQHPLRYRAAPPPPMHRHSAPTSPNAEAPMTRFPGQIHPQRSRLSEMTHTQEMSPSLPLNTHNNRFVPGPFPPQPRHSFNGNGGINHGSGDPREYGVNDKQLQRNPAFPDPRSGAQARRVSGDMQPFPLPNRSRSFAEGSEYGQNNYQQEAPLFSSTYNALPIVRPRPRSAPRADDAAAFGSAYQAGSQNMQQEPISVERPHFEHRPVAHPTNGMPLSPGSFDVFNPNTSITNPSLPKLAPQKVTADHTPMYAGQLERENSSDGGCKFPPIPDPQQPTLDPNSPIRKADGRLVDPSDHLPPASYAPEPQPKSGTAKRPSVSVNIKSRFGPREAKEPSQGRPLPPSASALNPVSTRAQKRQTMPVKSSVVIPLRPSPSAALNIGAPHHYDAGQMALSQELAKIDIGRVGERAHSQSSEIKLGNGRLRKARPAAGYQD